MHDGHVGSNLDEQCSADESMASRSSRYVPNELSVFFSGSTYSHHVDRHDKLMSAYVPVCARVFDSRSQKY